MNPILPWTRHEAGVGILIVLIILNEIIVIMVGNVLTVLGKVLVILTYVCSYANETI